MSRRFSTRVLPSLPESTQVMETFWRRCETPPLDDIDRHMSFRRRETVAPRHRCRSWCQLLPFSTSRSPILPTSFLLIWSLPISLVRCKLAIGRRARPRSQRSSRPRRAARRRSSVAPTTKVRRCRRRKCAFIVTAKRGVISPHVGSHLLHGTVAIPDTQWLY